MSIDDAIIQNLISFDDPDGVLSFYTGFTPAQAADPQPTSQIEIRNQIKAIRAEFADIDDRDRERAVNERLDAVAPEVERLLDPRASGRGRSLFVGVRSGRTESVAVQIPFADRVIYNDSAYVRPLVAALDEGRPAGILVVSRSSARRLAWSLGEATEEADYTFDLPDQVLADEKSGPSPSNPQHPYQGHVNRDKFEDRVAKHLRRDIRHVVEDTLAQVTKGGWDRLVVSAPPKLRDTVAELIGDVAGVRVLLAEQAWEDFSTAQIAEHAFVLLRSVHRDRERALVREATERTLAGGAGALGLRAVCDALNEGRVAHLLYDDTMVLEGYVAEDGAVHPRSEGGEAVAEMNLSPEPFFIERLVVKTITTSGLVTPVDEPAADDLAGHDGIGALLRW